MVPDILGLRILFFVSASLPDAIAHDELPYTNPMGIEDIEMELLDLNDKPTKTDDPEGRFIDDNLVKMDHGLDR